MTSKANGKEAKDSKDAKSKEAKQAEPGPLKFLIRDSVRVPFVFDNIELGQPDGEETALQYYPASYRAAKDVDHLLIFRLPFLHSGFGADRPEFTKADGKSKKGAAQISWTMLGKPLDHYGAANPIDVFEKFIIEFDNATMKMAHQFKLLGGDDVTFDTYQACYVPILRQRDHRYPATITAKLNTVYGHPQWSLWLLPSKVGGKAVKIPREKLGYDVLCSADIKLHSLWVNKGGGGKPSYGWSIDCDNVYHPGDAYNADYTSRKTETEVCPW